MGLFEDTMDGFQCDYFRSDFFSLYFDVVVSLK